MAGVTLRPAQPGDLPQIALIQAQSPEAARWDPREYLQHDCTVALCGDELAGFAVARTVGAGEREILNLAVHPKHRRRGIGRALFENLRASLKGTIFLEVRESNHAARHFYESLGFHTVSVRRGYYETPPECGIVMKFHSC